MLEQVTTSEETKAFSCYVWMLRMTLTLTYTLKWHSGVSFDLV